MSRETIAFLEDLGVKNPQSKTYLRGVVGLSIAKLLERRDLLNELGVSDKAISRSAHLLGSRPETLKRKYGFLVRLGFKKSTIASTPSILGISEAAIASRFIGHVMRGITSNAVRQNNLTTKRPEALEQKIEYLVKRFKIPRTTIEKTPSILSHSIAGIQRKYEHHISWLREDYTNRESGRNILFTHLPVFCAANESLEANVQFLSDLGITCNNSNLYFNLAQKKREKMAWVLREIFDYRQSDEKEDKTAKIKSLRRFVAKYAYRILTRSIEHLSKNKQTLMKLAEPYRQEERK